MGRRSGGGGGMRSASPRASAPVRRSSPSPPPASSRAAPPPAAAAAAPGHQGPGLMGQMAATAGGVAIGSAVGHAVGNMMTGGGGRGEQVAAAGQGHNDDQSFAQQPLKQACEFEWQQFVECTQNASDVSMCQSLNEAFKKCNQTHRA